MLEEQIAVLEARLEDLEHPEGSALTLHDPYSDYRSPGSRGQLSPAATSSSGDGSGFTPLDEPLPAVLHEALIQTFLYHSSEVGFFLNPSRLTSSPRTLSPALLNVIYLVGCHFSESDHVTASEPLISSRAQMAMMKNRPSNALEWIQAEVLYANDCFRSARILEGKYHTSAAVSLVLSAGLQKVHSAESPMSSSQLLGLPVLAPPQDAMEQGERINAFWTVLNLNNCWTTADGSPSNISYGAPGFRVDSPWPLLLSAYLETRLSPGSHTVQNFLAGSPDDGHSVLALYAKAAILFEQTSRLNRQYKPNMTTAEFTQFLSAFDSLAVVLDRFIQGLPAVEAWGDRMLLVVHTLAHVACIQLYNPFISQNSDYYARFVSSAKTVVAVLRDADLSQVTSVDAILAPLWVTACRALMVEVARYRSSQSLSFQDVREQGDLEAAIETILQTMARLAPHCQLMDIQRSRARDAYSTNT